jgi:superfamily II DNA/RNA helicase
MSFAQFKLLPSLVASLKEQSITTPTDIQSRTLPALVDGQSVIGVAETGSGKTLSYVLPMLHRLKTLEMGASGAGKDAPGKKGAGGAGVSQAGRPRGLVLVPARELGEQVCRVFKSLTHGTRLRVRSVLGGSRKQVARRNVAGAFEILVATPGRLIHLLEGGELRLSDVRMLVFDEADQLLDPGFRKVALRIIEACPRAAQLVLFSATLPEPLASSVKQLFRKPPLHVQSRGSRHLVRTLKTMNRTVVAGIRINVLRELFAHDSTTGSLLFSNTRKQCDEVSGWLHELDIPHVVYRGEMDRVERRANLKKFRDGEVHALLATDLGGRGLDIARIGRVINVHLPQDIDNYRHRVGRTARAGRSGLVVNLVTNRDQPLMKQVKRLQAP